MTGFEADGAGDLWRELQANAAPIVMLRLPPSASLLDAGTGSAGVGLVLADLLAETTISDGDPTRLARLRVLAKDRDLRRVEYRTGSPKQSLLGCGPFDVVLMLGGWGDAREEDLLGAVKPSGQVALQLRGSLGKARDTRRRLLNAGFSAASIMIPWPILTNSPVAWVEIDSAVAWSTLVDRWLPSTGTPGRRAFARACRGLAGVQPGVLRSFARYIAPTFCIVATR